MKLDNKSAKTCPCCKGEYAWKSNGYYDDRRLMAIYCEECGLRTPYKKDISEVVAIWNRRPDDE